MSSIMRSINSFKLLKDVITCKKSATRIVASHIHTCNRDANVATKQMAFLGHTSTDSLLRISFRIKQGGFIQNTDLFEAMESMETSSKISSNNFMTMLQACGKAAVMIPIDSRHNLVSKVWSMQEKLDLGLDISHYNNLLDVYAQNGYNYSPISFLEELQKKNVEPNRVTYNRLIQRFCQVGNIDGANKILEIMKEKQIPITDHIFQSFILGNARNKDIEGIQSVVDLSEKTGIEMSAYFYGALFSAYAELNEVEKASDIYEQAIREGMKIKCESFLDAMVQFAANDNLEAIQKFPPISLDKFSITHFLETISTLVAKKKADAALILIRNLQKEANHSVSIPNLKAIYPQMLAIHNYEPQVIAEHCKILSDSGQSPWGYEHALKKLLVLYDVDAAIEYLGIMKEHDRELLDHYFYPILVKAKSMDPEERMSVVNAVMSMHDFTAKSIKIRILHLIPHETTEELWEKLKSYGSTPLEIKARAILDLIISNEGAKQGYQFLLSQESLKLDGYAVKGFTDDLMQTKSVSPFVDLCARIARDNEEEEQRMWDSIIDQVVVPCVRERKTVLLEKLFKKMGESSVSIPMNEARRIKFICGRANGHVLRHFDTIPVREGTGDPETIEQLKITELEQKLSGEDPLAFSFVIECVNLMSRNEDHSRIVSTYETLRSKARVMEEEELIAFAHAFHAAKEMNHLEDALNHLSELRGKMYGKTLMDYAMLLVEIGRFEEGVEILQKQSRDEVSRKGYGNVKQFLRLALKNLSPENMEQFKDELVKADFISKSVLDTLPLLQALDHGDINQALESYKDFDKVPLSFTRDFVKACIDTEDMEIIKKALIAMESSRGAAHTLSLFGFYFIEREELNQAELAFSRVQNPLIVKNFIEQQLDYWLDNNLPSHAESFIRISDRFRLYDKYSIFVKLFEYYRKHREGSKALELWTLMQEHNVFPDEDFMKSLYDFLTKSNIKPPFSDPNPSKTEENKPREILKKNEISKKNEEFNRLTKALEESNFDEAVECFTAAPMRARNYMTQTLLKRDMAESLLDLFLKLDHTKQRFLIRSKLLKKMLAESPELHEKYLEMCESVGRVRTSKTFHVTWFNYLWDNNRREEAKQFYKQRIPGSSIYLEVSEFKENDLTESLSAIEDFLREDPETNASALENLHLYQIICHASRGRFEEANRMISETNGEYSNHEEKLLTQAKGFYEEAGAEFPITIDKKVEQQSEAEM